MKKLMIALAAAATTMLSFGAGPTFEVSGTSFEGYPTNILQTAKDDVAGNSGDNYWYTADQDAENIISNYFGFGETDPKEIPIASRPDYFAPSNNEKFLQLETTGKLFRSALPNGQTTEFAQVAIPDQGIYLDTLVKFTAADDVFGADALEANIDKIAIEYVEREDDDTTPENEALTNFVVRAGYVTGEGTVTATNYLASVPAGFDKDAWHRLTVRAIADVGDGTVGFIVYLDGDMTKKLTYSTDVAAGYDGYIGNLNNFVKENFYSETAHALFPSAVRTGGDKSNISAVAFSGNGSVDDVTFTVNKPGFIQEVTTVTVTWDTSKVTAVTLNGTGLTAEEWALGSCEIAPLNGVVTFGADFAEGYTRGECTVTGGGNWDGLSAFENLSAGAVCNIGAMFPLYEVNGVSFDDLDAALTAAAAGTDQAPATLKLLADCNQALNFTQGYIVLDLAGCDIQGNGSDFSIGNSGATLIITNSGAEASILIPADNGAGGVGTGPLFAAAGFTTIQAGTFEGVIYSPALLDQEDSWANYMLITGGKFIPLSAYDPTDPTSFYLYACVAQGLTLSQSGDYVQVGSGAQPIGTYQVTVTTNENATYAAVYKDGGATITPENDVLTVTVGKTIVITATPNSGYEYAEEPTGWTLSEGVITIEVSEAGTVAIPAPAVIEYVTLTITSVANCTIVVSNATAEVATGTQFNKADAVQLTVYRTPADGYVLDNCAATETITMDQDQTVTAAVKVSGGYPTYIDTEDADEKAKYDAWKAAMTTAGVDIGDGEAYEDAYLLNCKPAEVTAEAAAFKFTKIAFEGGVWVTETTNKNTSGADYNGTVTVTRYSDVGCTTASETGNFFKAELK